MDPQKTVLGNLRNVVGCNGLRTIVDLGIMKQATLERRLADTLGKLPVRSIASIYALWLRQNMGKLAEDLRLAEAVHRCCDYLVHDGCDRDIAIQVFQACFSLGQDDGSGSKAGFLWDKRWHMGYILDFICRIYSWTGANTVTDPKHDSPADRFFPTQPLSPRLVSESLGRSNENVSLFFDRTPPSTEIIENFEYHLAAGIDTSTNAQSCNFEHDNETIPRHHIAKELTNSDSADPTANMPVSGSYICRRCGVKGWCCSF